MKGHLRLAIRDEASLLAINAYLHDGDFDREAPHYDPATGTFTLTMRRELPGGLLSDFFPGFFAKYARCRLVLRQVESARIKEVDDGSKRGLDAMFYEVNYRPDIREIEILDCMEIVEISLRVRQIDGELEDISDVTSAPTDQAQAS